MVVTTVQSGRNEDLQLWLVASCSCIGHPNRAPCNLSKLKCAVAVAPMRPTADKQNAGASSS